MGSGASSAVQGIEIDQKDGKLDQRPRSSASRPSSAVRPTSSCRGKASVDTETKTVPFTLDSNTDNNEISSQLASHRNSSNDSQEDTSQMKQQITQLEKQIGDLESEKLDLQEQVSGLEERLEQSHAENVAHDAQEEYKNTLSAKDNYILKLEQETKQIQLETSKLKSRYKKKLRVANSLLEEAKHHTSLKIFEMKDEIGRLTEENTRLLDRLSDMRSGVNASSGRMSVLQEEDEGRNKVILNLSSQISEQDARIVDLENQLTDKDRLIEQLQESVKSRPNSVKSQRSRSPKTKESQRSSRKDTSFQEWEDSSVTDGLGVLLAAKSPRNHVSGNIRIENDCHSTSRSKHKGQGQGEASLENGDLSELTLIAQEMKRLKKKKNKDTNRLVEAQSNKDFRVSSGVSHDSGVISMETDLDGKVNSVSNNRVSSATSTLSAFSDDDNDLDLDNLNIPIWNKSKREKKRIGSGHSINSTLSDLEEDDSIGSRKLDPASIRKISAPKGKRKQKDSEYKFIDNLLKSTNTEQSIIKPVSGKPPRYKPAVTTY